MSFNNRYDRFNGGSFERKSPYSSLNSPTSRNVSNQAVPENMSTSLEQLRMGFASTRKNTRSMGGISMEEYIAAPPRFTAMSSRIGSLSDMSNSSSRPQSLSSYPLSTQALLPRGMRHARQPSFTRSSIGVGQTATMTMLSTNPSPGDQANDNTGAVAEAKMENKQPLKRPRSQANVNNDEPTDEKLAGKVLKKQKTSKKEVLKECPHCGYKRGKSASNFSRHMQTHAVKKIKCEVCEYRCHRKDRMVVHMRTHTGEKPIACELCEYRCAERPSLLKHMRSHEKLGHVAPKKKQTKKK